MDKTDFDFVSGGRNPNCERVCQTCQWLHHDPARDGGWCRNSLNRVPPQSGWPNGFTPSVSSTGGCNLHRQSRLLDPVCDKCEKPLEVDKRSYPTHDYWFGKCTNPDCVMKGFERFLEQRDNLKDFPDLQQPKAI